MHGKYHYLLLKVLKMPQPMNNLPFQMALILLYNRGLSDKDWCEQHSLPTSTFYTKISRLRKKACDIPKAEKQLLSRWNAPDICRKYRSARNAVKMVTEQLLSQLPRHHCLHILWHLQLLVRQPRSFS